MSDIFKREMNWSTYQDKQLGVLKSLESSFGDSLSISKSLKGNLDKTAEALDSILRSAELLASNMKGKGQRGTTSDTRDPYDLGRLIEEAERKRREDAEKEDARRREAEKELEERNRRAQGYLEKNQEEREKSERQYKENIQSTLKDWGNKFFKYMADVAKDFSDTRNAFIQNSGIIGEESQELRGTISREITRDLNRDTGNFYNPRKVYEAMAKVSAEASIGNRKILEDISRPILLAQESMNVNTTELAGMFGRWSKRYNFSSMAMEEMVDDIRGNTAGNNASEEAIQEAMNSLENLVLYYSGGDETRTKEMMKGVGTAVAYAEDLGLDSSFITTNMKEAMDGTFRGNKATLSALGKVGMSPEEYASLMTSGTSEGVMKAMQAYIEGTALLADDTMTNNPVKAQTSDVYGMDLDTLLSFSNAVNSDGYQNIFDFEASNKDNPTAADTVESKHLGFMEKIVNNLDTMLEKSATFQEKLGINLSEIITAIVAIKGVSTMFGGMKGGFTKLFSGATTTGAFTKFFGKGTASLAGGLGGMLGSIGPALGVAGAAAGLALLVKDIHDTVKKDDEAGAEPYQDALAGSEVSPYGYGYKGSYDPETGKTKWSYGALDEESAKDKDANFNQYIKDTKENMSIWERAKLGITNDYRTNTLAKAYGIKTWEDREREAYEKADTVLNAYAYRDMVNFYQGKHLLNTRTEIDHFAKNIKKYDKYWKKGMYLADKKWYTVDGDELVTSGAPKAFAVGSNYIEKDQLAFLHEGEAVVPKKYNPAANQTELESLRERMKNQESVRGNKTQRYLQETVETLREIKEFMAVWKDDSFRNTSLSEKKNRLNTFASSYMRTE